MAKGRIRALHERWVYAYGQASDTVGRLECVGLCDAAGFPRVPAEAALAQFVGDHDLLLVDWPRGKIYHPKQAGTESEWAPVSKMHSCRGRMRISSDRCSVLGESSSSWRHGAGKNPLGDHRSGSTGRWARQDDLDCTSHDVVDFHQRRGVQPDL